MTLRPPVREGRCTTIGALLTLPACPRPGRAASWTAGPAGEKKPTALPFDAQGDADVGPAGTTVAYTSPVGDEEGLRCDFFSNITELGGHVAAWVESARQSKVDANLLEHEEHVLRQHADLP